MDRSRKQNTDVINSSYSMQHNQKSTYNDQVDIIDSILDLQPSYTSKKDNRFMTHKDPRLENNNIYMSHNKSHNPGQNRSDNRETRNLRQQIRMDEDYDSDEDDNRQTDVKSRNPYAEEIEQDTINNNLMLRLNSELDIKKGNDRKKKNVILKPFVDKGPSLYENLFSNQISDFRGNYAKFASAR